MPPTPTLSAPRRSTRGPAALQSPSGLTAPALSHLMEKPGGPSTPPSRPIRGRATPTSNSNETPVSAEGSGSRRVLPARIRRAAGGGQEGIRDLEEMIVDWLERWGLPSDTPPESLPIHLSTLPLHLIDPPTTSTSTAPPQPLITLTPTNNKPAMPIPSPRRADLILDAGKIETPGWIVIRPGDDDAEEAREELENRKTSTSPLKRLRRLAPDEGAEDTSDSYYLNLHRKYEVFERRQRIREKEKLNFERYKMKSRIELLRNMSSIAWATVVNTVLSRTGESSWDKGREVLKEEGVDWLRDRLVKEGREVLKRYDQLLPVEQRKPTNRAASTAASTPTPERVLEDSPRLSSSPAPVLPARVTALRDPNSQKKPRTSTSTRETPTKRTPSKVIESEYDDPSILLPRKRKRPSDSKRPPVYTQTTLSFVNIEPKKEIVEVTQPVELPAKTESDVPSETPRRPSQRSTSSRSESTGPLHSPHVPIMPCLLEAASRRESAIEEAEAAKAKFEARLEASKNGEKVSRIIAREKTRTSGRLGEAFPFGLPFPTNLEQKSEFNITDEEDFWGIIAGREAKANMVRRNSQLTAEEQDIIPSGVKVKVLNGHGIFSQEDVADMREVEAAVVL